MVSLLDLADRANLVAELTVVLDALRERNELPDIEVLRAQFAPRPTLMPFVQVKLPATAVWGTLFRRWNVRRVFNFRGETSSSNGTIH